MTRRAIAVDLNDLGPYPAEVETDALGEYDTWNGWIAEPLFDRATVERIAADLAADPDRSLTIEFDGPDALIADANHRADDELEGRTYQPERVTPDATGRFAIGSHSLVWSEAEPLPCGCEPQTAHEPGCDGNHWPHDGCTD